MDQGQARSIAREHSRAERLVIATTEDVAHGRWERTHTWGVVVDGQFYGDATTAQEHAAPKGSS